MIMPTVFPMETYGYKPVDFEYAAIFCIGNRHAITGEVGYLIPGDNLFAAPVPPPKKILRFPG